MAAKDDRVHYGYFRNDPLVDFYAVFRESTEKAEKMGEYVKMFFLTALAGWLPGAQFTRTKRDGPPEPDWFVLSCSAAELDVDAPIVTAARQGLKTLERDDKVSLYDVFSGLNMDLKKG